MALIDTSAVIDLGHGNKKAREAVERAGGQYAVKVPAPVIFELSAGNPAGLDERRRRLVGVFAEMPFTAAHAEKAGIVYKQLREKGLEIDAFDAMIAGTALVEGQPVITANARHFSRVEGLQVISY
ncbi:MAG: PIN domain-containing protein [Candidatus Micrarchaeota archaeon]